MKSSVGQVVSLIKRRDSGQDGEERGTPECAATGELHEVDTASPEELSDAGMSTVEYAIGTVVAAAFAAVLYQIVTGDSVVSGLTDLINRALSTSF